MDTRRDLAAAGASGTLSVRSPYAVAETVARIKQVLQDKGLTLFALIDHSGGARSHGLELNDTQLLIFGDPRAGTAAMAAAPLLALDLPLKALVWAGDTGQVWVTYQDAADLRRRYRVPAELVEPLSHVAQLVAAALEA